MYQLQAIFLYNDEVWGTLDEETGKWNGVIGMVGYSHVQYHIEDLLLELYFLRLDMVGLTLEFVVFLTPLKGHIN